MSDWRLYEWTSWRPPKSYVAAIQSAPAHWEISQYARLSASAGPALLHQFAARLLHIDAHQLPDFHQLHRQLQEQRNSFYT